MNCSPSSTLGLIFVLSLFLAFFFYFFLYDIFFSINKNYFHAGDIVPSEVCIDLWKNPPQNSQFLVFFTMWKFHHCKREDSYIYQCRQSQFQSVTICICMLARPLHWYYNNFNYICWRPYIVKYLENKQEWKKWKTQFCSG